MKTIPVSKRSRGINVLLKRARRENVILQAADGGTFLLAELDDFDREIELARGNKALMRLLDARSRQSQAFPLERSRRTLEWVQGADRRGAASDRRKGTPVFNPLIHIVGKAKTKTGMSPFLSTSQEAR